MSNVVPMSPQLPKTLTRDEATELVRGVIADSGNLVWKDHALQRMEERDVTTGQVLQVLKRGTVIADPVFGKERNWEITMEAVASGEVVRVAVALDVDRMGYMVLIITVMVV